MNTIILKAIKKIVDENPEITDFGFSSLEDGKKLSKMERQRLITQERTRLYNSILSIEKIYYWICNNLVVQSTINKNISSYNLKQKAELDVGYISNGAFIVAALYSGLKYRRVGPNAYFNIKSSYI